MISKVVFIVVLIVTTTTVFIKASNGIGETASASIDVLVQCE